MLPDRLYFLEYEIRPTTRQLLCNGSPISMGARAFDLLLYLIRNRDRVLTRDELMKQVWSGITVGDNNLNVQVSILRKLLGSQAIVTLPGRGLRFGLEVSETRLIESEPGLPLPAKPSVVLLPYMDLGVDPRLSWLPDSIVEDITTELSRFRNLFVVARNSAFTYRDQPTDVRQISRQMGLTMFKRNRKSPTAICILQAITAAITWLKLLVYRIKSPSGTLLQVVGKNSKTRSELNWAGQSVGTFEGLRTL